MDELDEMTRLRRGFRLGLLAVAIAFVLIGGLVAAYGSGADRPEGVAERWLNDVGDTTRDGVGDTARDQADDVGPVRLAEHLLPPPDRTDGRSAFVDLEVGKAVTDGGRTLVPFRLHQRLDGDAGPPIDGTIALTRRASGGWEVVDVSGPTAGLEVPSEGGRPAAKAPWELFAGALVVSALIAAACGLVVRAAGRGSEPAPAA
jgi:hypothetical protein